MCNVKTVRCPLLSDCLPKSIRQSPLSSSQHSATTLLSGPKHVSPFVMHVDLNLVYVNITLQEKCLFWMMEVR